MVLAEASEGKEKEWAEREGERERLVSQ